MAFFVFGWGVGILNLCSPRRFCDVECGEQWECRILTRARMSTAEIRSHGFAPVYILIQSA